jgi:uncharacterized protein YjbI with pentapeptide repeats
MEVFRLQRRLLLAMGVFVCALVLGMQRRLVQHDTAPHEPPAEQEALLQAYRSQMADLLRQDAWRKQDGEGRRVRHLARTQTLSTLRHLDGERKGHVVAFLAQKGILATLDLTRADLRQADLTELDLSQARLTEADLASATLDGAALRGASLEGADLFKATLRGAVLESANLRQVNLYRANLEGTNLRGANLEEANLFRAQLQGANLAGANLRDAERTRRVQLEQALSLRGATMPDGSVHP